MKFVLVFFTVVLIIGSLGAAYYYNQHAFGAQKALEKERYTRMTSEERLEKANHDLRLLKTKLKHAETKIAVSENMIEKKNSLNKDLQRRLETILTIQENLKKELQRLEYLEAERNRPAPAISR